MKKYLVKENTLLGGQYVDKGQVLTLSDEDAKTALAGKFVERAKEDGEDDDARIDVAPSQTPTHETKRVVAAESTADKKAAQAEEK